MRREDERAFRADVLSRVRRNPFGNLSRLDDRGLALTSNPFAAGSSLAALSTPSSAGDASPDDVLAAASSSTKRLPAPIQQLRLQKTLMHRFNLNSSLLLKMYETGARSNRPAESASSSSTSANPSASTPAPESIADDSESAAGAGKQSLEARRRARQARLEAARSEMRDEIASKRGRLADALEAEYADLELDEPALLARSSSRSSSADASALDSGGTAHAAARQLEKCFVSQLRLRNLSSYLKGPSATTSSASSTRSMFASLSGSATELESCAQSTLAKLSEPNAGLNVAELCSASSASALLLKLPTAVSSSSAHVAPSLHEHLVVSAPVPHTLQADFEHCYLVACELLRRFWGCFPVISPTSERTLERTIQLIRRFRAERIPVLSERAVQESPAEVSDASSITRHVEAMLDAALHKFELWSAKKAQVARPNGAPAPPSLSGVSNC